MYAEPLEDEMWTALLPEGWTSPYGEILQHFLNMVQLMIESYVIFD